MTLNSSKSKYIVFQPERWRQGINFPESIKSLNGEIILRVDSHRYLGVILDGNLNYGLHIEHVCKKVRPIVNVLTKLKFFLPSYILLKIYFSHIHSHLTYMAPLYGMTTANRLQELQVLQNRALKQVFMLPFDFSTLSLYTDFARNILPIKGITFLSSLIFIHKLKTGVVSSLIKVPLQENSRRSYGQIIPFNFELKQNKRDITSTGFKLYNALPNEITERNDIDSFKYVCRNFLNYHKNHLLDLTQFFFLNVLTNNLVPR